MEDVKKICIPTASRSERELIQPLIRELKNHPKFEVDVLELPVSFSGAFEASEEYLRVHGIPDFALCGFDRIEMLGACLAFFLKGALIIHLYSGSSVGGNVRDEVVGMMMAYCAHICLCHDEVAANFLRNAGIENWRIKIVGSIAFDNIQLDESVIPEEPFDLILINPDTTSKFNSRRDIKNALSLIDKYAIIIYPNEDEYREVIIEEINNWKFSKPHVIYQTISRTQFLAFLKHAERFITNSSAEFFEAPYFNTKCIHIGERNKYRKVGKIVTGGVKRIINVLEEIHVDKKLFRKRLFT